MRRTVPYVIKRPSNAPQIRADVNLTTRTPDAIFMSFPRFAWSGLTP